MEEGRQRGGDTTNREWRFQLGKEGKNMGNVDFGKGEGRGGRYFHRSRKFGIASAKNWRTKYHQTWSLIQSGLWTVAVAPSRISRMRTILWRCSKTICVASHTVGYNKLCGLYLIFLLDLNYIMGSLLDLLSAVNMQLYVCRKRIGIIQGSFGHFIH